METDRWLTRREVAERLQLPVGTLADWASKGTGPRYARFGKHTRYRLADVIAWESEQMAERKTG
jgi:excisionase family DNA binding protein